MLTLCLSVASPAQLPPELTGVKRIVCLGDSITQSGERPGGYVWLLRHYLAAIYPNQQIEVRNAGISGNKSTDMLVRFQKDVLDRHPDLVTISVGVNDVWHGFYDGHTKGDGPLGIPLPDYRKNVESLVDQALKANAKVVLLSATLIEEDTQSAENLKAVDFNKALREIAEARKIPFVDLQSAFRSVIGAYRQVTASTRNFLTVDGVHMNAQGNQLMSDCILNTLGVPESDRKRVSDKVLADVSAKGAPVVNPPGTVVSTGKTATASSETPGYPASNATAAFLPGSTLRWCANDGNFKPNPWWMVDLGQADDLTGVRILFSPEELDTWKYRVEVSTDGIAFHSVVDETSADDFFNEKSHVFSHTERARYLRIVFTDPTSAMNWASLRSVLVFAQ